MVQVISRNGQDDVSIPDDDALSSSSDEEEETGAKETDPIQMSSPEEISTDFFSAMHVLRLAVGVFACAKSSLEVLMLGSLGGDAVFKPVFYDLEKSESEEETHANAVKEYDEAIKKARPFESLHEALLQRDNWMSTLDESEREEVTTLFGSDFTTVVESKSKHVRTVVTYVLRIQREASHLSVEVDDADEASFDEVLERIEAKCGDYKKTLQTVTEKKKALDDLDSIAPTALCEVLSDYATAVSSNLLLRHLFRPDHIKCRIATACFLYFVSHAHIPDTKHYRYLNFLYPLMNITVPQTSAASEQVQKLQAITSNVLDAYDARRIYIPPTENTKFAIFPPLELFWHELVRGMLLGALWNCLPDASFPLSHATIDADIRRARNYLLLRKCHNSRTWLQDFSKKWKQPEHYKAQSMQRDHHLFFVNSYHGGIFQKKLVQIPFNVTLIKQGVMGSLSVSSDQVMTPENIQQDPNPGEAMVNRDSFRQGLEIITSGNFYPEIDLKPDSSDNIGLQRIDTRVDLDTARKITTLSQLLNEVSQNAYNEGRNAIVFVAACQYTKDIDHQTIGLATVFSTMRSYEGQITFETSTGPRIIDYARMLKLSNLIRSAQVENHQRFSQANGKRIHSPDKVDVPLELRFCIAKAIQNACTKHAQQGAGYNNGRRAAVVLLSVVTVLAAFAH